MQTQIEKRYYTREEYLALEEAAEYKSEYLDGEIVPMAGGTTNHNHIIVNLVAHLKFALRGQNYNLFTSDVRLWIPGYRRYTYPDVMAIAGEPVYESDSATTVTNPLIIIEVLSKSTRSYDESDKFRCYRSIPEFKEYILIDQYKFYVEQFAKNSDGKWVLTEYESLDALLTLASINFQISFSDIYEMVNFQKSGD
jgi:Uma2 family endonuclease